MKNLKTKFRSFGLLTVILLSSIPIIFLIANTNIETSEVNQISFESENHLFTEDFTTTNYRDSGNTDVFGWGLGEITNSRKDPTLIGSGFMSTWTQGVFVLDKYAYMASGRGLLVADISNPTNPESVGNCNPPGYGDAYEVFVSGDFAYLIEHEDVYYPFDMKYTLHIIDIRPTSPTYLKIKESFILLETDDWCWYDIYISGDLAYIIVGVNLYVIDISDPINPILIGSLNNLKTTGNQLYISGDYAYVATWTSLDIIDISDPVNPIKLSSIKTFRLCDIYVLGNYAYATKSYEGLYVFDISDPYNPVKISECITGGECLRMDVSGNFAFISSDRELQVIDISIPSNPIWIASWVASPAYLSDVYILNDYAYITGSESLFIIKISDVGEYKSQCNAQSIKINNNGYILSATLFTDDSIPAGTDITYLLSADGGLRWEEVTSGVLLCFTYSEFDLRWKAVLSVSDIAPSIQAINISYKLAEPGDQDINIITPDSKVYTQPMSGYFFSTYGFENEEHGTRGESIDFIDEYVGDQISHIGINIRDGPVNGHKKILTVGDAQTYFRTWCVHNFTEPQKDGTVEFFLWSNQPPPYWGSITKRHYMEFRANDDTVAFSMMVQLHDSKIFYNTGSDWKLLATVTPEVWYHHSVSFDCNAGLNGQFTWIISDEQGNEINKVENLEFENNLATIDEIYISSDHRDHGGHTNWDAFGFSWDPNYEIGDNLNEGLLLYYDTEIDLNWTGYSLDNQQNITIMGNTVIKMPEDGTHRIQVFGNDSLGKFYQSDVRYFAINEWEDITPPVITIDYQDGDETDGNSGKWNVNAYDDESGINEATINILIDGEFSGDSLGEYEVPNELGEHFISVYIENNLGYTSSGSDTITIIDDDTVYPEINYIYTGDGTDGNPGEIVVTASDDSGLSIDPTGIYSVPNSLGTHTFIFFATDNDNDRVDDTLTQTVEISISIIDDDVEPPEIDIQYIGSGFDGDPGYFEWDIIDLDSGINEINITVIYASTEGLEDYVITLLSSETGSWNLPPYLGTYTIEVFTRDNDNDRALIVDSLTTELVRAQEIVDDDIMSPELSNIEIIPDIFEINITFDAIDESGVGDISTFINGEFIEPLIQAQNENTYSLVFENQWAFESGTHEVIIQVEDGDNDRPNDTLTSQITSTFESILYQMYEYVDWQLEGLKNYINENLYPCIASFLNRKLSRAQYHLDEAFSYIENEKIICVLFHDAMAKVMVQITEFKVEILNRLDRINDEHAEYIIDSLHTIRNNIVLLMGASTGKEQGYTIASIEVDLLNLYDFIEEEINLRKSGSLKYLLRSATRMLERAIFKISMNLNIECLLECALRKLEWAMCKVNRLLDRGKITQELANLLLDKMNQSYTDIEVVKNSI